MKWMEVSIKTTKEAVDVISDMLMTMGAAGVEIDDPNEIRRQISKLASPDYIDKRLLEVAGTGVRVKAYYGEQYNQEELTALIREKISYISNYLQTGDGLTGIRRVDDEDWSVAWKKFYHPFNITKGIVIKPTWESYVRKPGESVVEIDPGMAFGTGTHETTKLCAKLLELSVKPGDSVIDIGCGTGILSIIAAKLGAGHVTALDIDEMAVRITAENAKINGVDDRVSVVTGTLADIRPCKADVIVANIIADVIIDLFPDVLTCLKGNGLYLVSGIIRERKEDVMRVYTGLGFEIINILEMGEWVAISFRCPDSL